MGHRLPPVTTGLIALSLLVFLYSRMGNDFESLRPLLISWYLQPTLPELRDGQLWRLITPIFIHFGLLHITFNMMWLWDLGRVIEWIQGPRHLLALVAAIGIASNLGEYFYSGPAFGGMSGVLYGLLGYIWMQGKFNPRFGVRLHKPIVTMMLVWFVLCWSGFFELVGGIRIANMAHTGGLVVGLIWGYLDAQRALRRSAA
ncbi:MAG: rhomboid family intramembrane serine protease [Pseudomonadota bacterium]|nr:rhomboid family intramembrane serine protease [Pseudomonadota bacterium]